MGLEILQTQQSNLVLTTSMFEQKRNTTSQTGQITGEVSIQVVQVEMVDQ